ncbi:MAG: hypothetical protein SP1CHLAM54_13810 [Chlamydiia bacterium]|nr:hypothetical protein [Chlamydiia bacterium]MCH9616274.1 hypothetical protein [Chlamydiia bacterium]MCH9629740.1 hypothetical protein [Chlamydiia bacterium]
MCKVRRPFTLIELLLCIFLITLIAVPLARGPLHLFKHEITFLKEIEQNRLAELVYIDVRLKPLPKWDKLREGTSFKMPARTIELKGINTYKVVPTVTLKVLRPKEEEDEKVRLVKCTIEFPKSEKKYCYKYLVEKKEICNDQ